MFFKFIQKILGSRNQRLLKKYSHTLEKINALENHFLKITDYDLKKKYDNLRENYNKNEELSYLTETYAIVREVARRTLNMRHFDVQILGGLALYDEKITEIATGEGKTLVATLPACFHSLKNKKTHIVTVNDYLAKRDAEWMSPIYNFLNLKVGLIIGNTANNTKKESYEADIIYGTASEYGFDYLRDNIVTLKTEKVQNELNYVIIDEIDSVLIDEARTPLIISIPDKINKNLYIIINDLIKNLLIYNEYENKGDFIIDEKNKQVHLTDPGFLKLEALFKKYKILNNNINLYDINNVELLHIVYALLKAHNLFKKDIDYIIMNNDILIIDENTGRIMEGRRWGDGIHQAIEAKERLPIKNDNQILATITFQNYFRMYKKRSGMTGTAITEAIEFENIYGLEVIIIPTNKPCIRKDLPDIVFINKKAKFKAIIDDVMNTHKIGRPVLVGTTSINTSEFLSDLLIKNNIKHNVLNAKYHDKESAIIAEAGKKYNVTIATNMAGRGTDIVLGGKESHENMRKEIISLGGLKVIGVERHESRRIDNQLRGRTGRQGDPGESQFYLSLDDDLMRIFVGEKSINFLKKLNISDNEIISHPLVTKAIENAQKKIENHNFDIRKQLLEYDDIINEQRIVFYNYRNIIIFSDEIDNILQNIFTDVVTTFLDKISEQNIRNIINTFNKNFSFNINIDSITSIKDLIYVKNKISEEIFLIYKKKNESNTLINFTKALLLNILDLKWKEHLINLDLLKSGIHLRGYAQKDPKIEYKSEAFTLFEDMLNNSKEEFMVCLFKMIKDDSITEERDQTNTNVFLTQHDIVNKTNTTKTFTRVKKKINRNELCYCNSGKKYKHCHGQN